MIELKGEWNSDRYLENVHGDIILKLPDDMPNDVEFDFEMIFQYKGSFRKGESIVTKMTGIFKDKEEISICGSAVSDCRIVGRKKELGVNQQLLITINRSDNMWTGYYSTIYPVDIGRILCRC